MSRPINTLTRKYLFNLCFQISLQLFQSIMHGHISTIFRNITTVAYDLTCSQNCECDRNRFSPICGADLRTYYSSCYAGCRSSHIENGKTQFFDCDCIEMRKSSPFFKNYTIQNNRIYSLCILILCS